MEKKRKSYKAECELGKDLGDLGRGKNIKMYGILNYPC